MYNVVIYEQKANNIIFLNYSHNWWFLSLELKYQTESYVDMLLMYIYPVPQNKGI